MDGSTYLPCAKIHKKDPTKKLNNLPTNFVESFYKDWLGGIDFSEDTDFQQSIVNKTPSKDVKKFLLTTSDFGNEIQGELNLYRMDGKLKSAIFRRKLDPISKNVIRNESPIEFLFKNLKYFDAQNPVIGNLIKEIDIGKKKDLSKILKGAPGIIDLELMLRLKGLEMIKHLTLTVTIRMITIIIIYHQHHHQHHIFYQILDQINCHNLHHH